MPSQPNPPQSEITHMRMNDHMLGSIFDEKYRILSFIDKGGMGTIYKALQLSLNREVAIKLMQCPDDPIAEKRFFLEASHCAQLKHPNTIRIFDFGKSNDGHVYIVMELLHGQSMNQYIKQNGNFETLKALDICSKMCAALNEAHKNGIIHRDVKPSNIFLHMTEGEIHPKLIDFGLVKEAEHSSELSQTGLVMGSPMYMSPEQVDSKDITYASDIYSLGHTLYTMITGVAPFKKETMTQIMIAQLREHPRPLTEIMAGSQYPEPLQWTLQMATMKIPSRRFASMTAFRTAIEHCQKAIQTGQNIPLQLDNGYPNIADPNSMTQTVDLSNKALTIEAISPITEDFQALTSGSLLGISPPHPEHRNTIIKAIVLTTVASLFILAGVWAWLANSQSKTTATIQPAVEEVPPPKVEAPQLIKVTLDSEPKHAEVYYKDEFLGNTPYVAQLKSSEKRTVDVRLSGYTSKKITLSTMSLNPQVILEAIPVPRTRPVQARPAVPQAQPPPEPEIDAETDTETTPNHNLETKDPWAD